MSPTATLPSAADAAAALNGYQAPNSADLLTQAYSKYGVNDLQSRVQGLQGITSNLTNSIAAVDPSVTGRTAGSLVTEGQRSALVGREQQPLQTNLASENQALGTANNDLTTAQGNAKDMVSGEQADSKNKYDALLQTYQIASAREAAQAAAQADAEKQAESVREFNVDQAGQNSRAASSAANAAPSAAQVKGAIQQGLQSVTGSDGYVSPQDYANGLKQWLNAGLPRADYNKQYSNYRNPKNGYYDLAIKQAGL